MASLLKGNLKLAQVLAIEKGEKNKANRAITDLHRKSEVEKLYQGRTRTYTPANEDGEKLPDERQIVQNRAPEILKEAGDLWSAIWDITATKDWTNAGPARADIKIEDQILVKSAPVSWLLYMEKELNDIETFVRKIPVLDSSEEWTWSSANNCFASPQTWQNRTKKVPRNHVKAEATDKHPAQVEVYQEDQVIGRFNNINFSGALPSSVKEALLERVRMLRSAVLFAREEANGVQADKQKVGQTLLEFLLEPLKAGQ
jgi:hypothetical protein